MNNEPFRIIHILHPKDESLESYKSWMMEITKQLAGEKAVLQWTEEQWTANWKKFWQERINNNLR